MAIDTKTVKNRRDLKHIKTLDDVVAEARTIVAAAEAGKLQQLGNWDASQCFNHLATWMEFAFKDSPLPPPPWFIRLVMKFMRKRFIYGSLPVGISIPNVEGGTLGTEKMPLREALAKLEAAAMHLKREAPTKPNPMFGAMTHEEWQAAHVGHSRLHMSFLLPGGLK
jgi:hypothetical protein